MGGEVLAKGSGWKEPQPSVKAFCGLAGGPGDDMELCGPIIRAASICAADQVIQQEVEDLRTLPRRPLNHGHQPNMKDGVLLVQELVDGNEGHLAEKPDLPREGFLLVEVFKDSPVDALNDLLVL